MLQTSKLASKLLVMLIFLLVGGSQANAETIVLTFDFGPRQEVLDYYNGGLARGNIEDGNSGPGPDYDIVFSSQSGTARSSGRTMNCLECAIPSPPHALFVIGDLTINALSGFDTGFSFFYHNLQQDAIISIYDGPDGTGNLLASSGLLPDTDQRYKPFGLSFAGTARSVIISTTTTFYDNMTFGSVTPGTAAAVPEPASLLLISTGLAGVGARLRQRRRTKTE